jgi:prepilin-type processing-associated H-X9-DG protein
MELRLSSRRNAAMTLFEVGVVVAIVVVLVAVLFPYLFPPRTIRRSMRIGCINNLKQIGICYRVWEGDNRDTYPMGISVTNGGLMEMVTTGNVVQTFLVMSNEMTSSKILFCPSARSRTAAALSFSELANSNVSYFIGVDVMNGANPDQILSGDDNFEFGGVPVNPGLRAFGAHDPVAWTAARHAHAGNLVMADGSAQQVNDSRLTELLGMTGFATNRFALP